MRLKVPFFYSTGILIRHSFLSFFKQAADSAQDDDPEQDLSWMWQYCSEYG